MINYSGFSLSNYRFVFDPVRVQTIGSNPIVLDLPTTFIPIHIVVYLKSTTTAFDFTGNLIFNGPVEFNAGSLLQTLTDDVPSLIRQNNPGRPYQQPLNMTTEDGSDATQGDSITHVSIIGYNLNI